MQFQEAIQNALVTLLTGVLGLLVAFLIALAKKGFNWLNAKIESIEDKTFRENLQQLNTMLESVTNNVVVSLQQTLADDIKTSIKENDGKYTREDLLRLKDKALEQIRSQITEEDWGTLSSIYGNLVQHVEDLIEVNVYTLKANSAQAISSEVVTGFSE